MKNWTEIGRADELSAVPRARWRIYYLPLGNLALFQIRVITLANLKRVTAMNREFAV
jgi:hypothetical protein